MSKVSVLFVCMGNICRSPTAHGVFEQIVRNSGMHEHISIDSAGTHSYHSGEKPDHRSVDTAKQQGYDLSYIRSRKVDKTDFESFDYIIAMDSDNLMNLQADCVEEHRHKLHLFLEIANLAADKGHVDVPDPYYGGQKGFHYVFDLVEQGSHNLLALIKEKHL